MSLFHAFLGQDRPPVAPEEMLLLETGPGQFQIELAGDAIAPAFLRKESDPPLAHLPLQALIEGPTGELVAQAVTEALEAGRRIPCRFRWTAPRHERSFLLIIEPVAPPDDNDRAHPRFARGLLTDITSLTLAEGAFLLLEDSDRTLAHGLDYMPEPVLVCDIRHTGIPAVYVNRAFTAAFGYRNFEVCGRDPFRMLFGPQAHDAVTLLERLAQNEALPWRMFQCRTRDGVKVPCNVVFQFSAEGETFSLLRMTFLMEHAHSRDWQDEITPQDLLRMESQVVLNAAGGLINDFNNLLAGLQQREAWLASGDRDPHQFLVAASQSASYAANLVFELLRGTSYGKVPGCEPIRAQGPTEGSDGDIPTPGKGEHLLVVEDDAAVRDFIKTILRHAGFRATAVAKGDDAMRVLGFSGAAPVEPPIDLLITDLMLPDMSGLHLAQTLRGMGLEFPILLISGYFSHQTKESAATLRHVALIEKPFRARDLVAALVALRAQDSPEAAS